MANNFYNIFRCPDDLSEVVNKNLYLECKKCKKHFSILADNLVEMLPDRFPEWGLEGNENRDTEKGYFDLAHKPFSWKKDPVGWGFLYYLQSSGYRGFVNKEIEMIKKFIPESLKNGLMIDVSAGCGNYSVDLSQIASLFVHCEAEDQSLLNAKTRAVDCKRENIVFVRGNYLKLPVPDDFFNVAICTDTLIRGRNHEKELLKEIYRALKKGGMGIVDFHNDRPFASKRNPYISFYGKEKIKEMLGELGMNNFEIYSCGHFPTSLAPSEFIYKIMDRVFSFLPPTRYIAVIQK
ncbi:MAG: methyltransferase domain-containing protein [Candidatus Paceibacterota bacterium]|jgi:ubiquinone/menaquinone biosynthesis C-methylase UbiE